MAKIAYLDKNFRGESLALIARANAIIGEYAAQGYALTLRQLYYQLVARGIIPNDQSEYKKLGNVINDARLAGLVDWLAIEDRTRNLRQNSHWDSPREIILSAAEQYKIDKWARQPSRLEVWIEKDALVGVIEGVCRSLDVPYFSCRGYTSASEMWRAGQRALSYNGQDFYVIHLGDHDPSGIDMTRDIQDRLDLFTGGGLVVVERVALNMDQVEQYSPPPNPAKLSDSRAQTYIAEYGDNSWELDALEPVVMGQLIESAVIERRDDDLWYEASEEEEEHKKQLEKFCEEV